MIEEREGRTHQSSLGMHKYGKPSEGPNNLHSQLIVKIDIESLRITMDTGEVLHISLPFSCNEVVSGNARERPSALPLLAPVRYSTV